MDAREAINGETPCKRLKVDQTKVSTPFHGGLNSPITILDIPPQSLSILQRMKIIQLRDLWSFTKQDLKNHGLAEKECTEILDKATIASAGKMFSCYQLSSQLEASPAYFTTGCQSIDDFLRGGIPCGRLTEICGEAGTGKTQLCLQLALTAQLPKRLGGLEGDCLYIFTENGFPSRRLKQICENFEKRAGEEPNRSPVSLDRIFVQVLDSLDKLESFLTIRIHSLLSTRPVRLIIVDSITSVFRYIDTDDVQIPQRAKSVQGIGRLLLGLQNSYGVSVVCSNQVTAAVRNEDVGTRVPPGSATVPALGIAWANFVSMRIMLRKTYNIPSDGSTSPVLRREFSVLFSPHLPASGMTFSIATEGICPEIASEMMV